jgi:phage tail-like protein
VLTPLEDRIADARVLTSPASAPDDALDWLARWTGERFPARLPREHRRAWLQQAPALRSERGTLAGLRRALDIATDGAVGLGRIVVVEDHLLRRTLATLIGIDLGRDDDPLLPGLVVSGNAIVGDTLVLGDADDLQARREFLALFGDDIDSEAERQTVASVYDRTAHRATVLVHDGLDAALLDLVRGIAEDMAPAHVALKVIAAREPFLEGIAALIGVDSYLRAPLPLRHVRIQGSRIGRGDRIAGGGALDPRLDDSATLVGHDGMPRARLQGAQAAPQPGQGTGQGGRILLDGTRSDPPAGGAIARWRFTRLPT